MPAPPSRRDVAARSIHVDGGLPVGTGHTSCESDAAAVRATRQRRETPIRTLGVSILAVAAVAASLIIARGRDEQDPTASLIPAGESQPAEQSLAAIRAAGL